MSLTKDDLQAIKQIVDDAVESSKQQTAAGFLEVHEKFADVDDRINKLSEELSEVKATVSDTNDTVGRIELQQREHAERLDDHDRRLNHVEHKLKPRTA